MPEITECDNQCDIPYVVDENILTTHFWTKVHDVNISYYINLLLLLYIYIYD